MGEKAREIMDKIIQSKWFKGTLAGIAVFGLIVFTSFTTVKLSAKNTPKSVEVATEIVGQLSDTYLTPKFNALNDRIDKLQAEVQKTNDWTAQKDDKDYRSLVILIDKQYEKLQRDKSDIKSADLKEIDEEWAGLPDKYKTTKVKSEYEQAMNYYMTIGEVHK